MFLGTQPRKACQCLALGEIFDLPFWNLRSLAPVILAAACLYRCPRRCLAVQVCPAKQCKANPCELGLEGPICPEKQTIFCIYLCFDIVPMSIIAPLARDCCIPLQCHIHMLLRLHPCRACDKEFGKVVHRRHLRLPHVAASI
jgi:hypothetical protein